jgi:hypothetical protein
MSEELKKECFEVWKAQGRTEEQIWAVENFLTGAGRNLVDKAKQQEEFVKMLTDKIVSEETIKIDNYHEDITRGWNGACENLLADLSTSDTK